MDNCSKKEEEEQSMRRCAAAAADGGGATHCSKAQQLMPASLRERYDLVSVRGKGNFAEVWEARHRRTGGKAAIKIISHAEMSAQSLSIEKVEREVSVMRLLRHHPHVIRFFEAAATRAHSYIVMELADAGQLFDHVVLQPQGRLPEPQARAIFQQLAATVLYCHRNMVTHRDLKMENVLLMAGSISIKIVDFGFSKFYTKPMLRKLGSPEYAAPELYGSGRYIGPQVDVWSCGVILYAMLCGGLPFDGADNDNFVVLARNVRRGQFRFPSWVSDDARDLISGMLIVSPHKRMTMAEVMAHRWLQPDTMPAYLAMPPPDARALQATAVLQLPMDEAAVEQLVTRHGYDRQQLMQQAAGEEDDAAVAYQLVLKADEAASRYLSMLSPEPEQDHEQHGRQWALGGLLDGLAGDCPRLTMQRIAKALEELRIPILCYHRHRHRIDCCAHHPAAAPDAALQMNNHILHSLSAAVFFEIQLYNTTGLFQGNNNNGRPRSSQEEQEEDDDDQEEDQHPHPRPRYAVHLNRTSGPLLPYLSICSQLSSKLRRRHN